MSIFGSPTLDGMLVYSSYPQHFSPVALTINQDPFILPGLETGTVRIKFVASVTPANTQTWSTQSWKWTTLKLQSRSNSVDKKKHFKT